MTTTSRQRLALAAALLGALGAPAAAVAAAPPAPHRQAARHAARSHTRPVRLEGVVQSVDPTTATLVVSVSGGAGRGARTLVGTDVTVSLGAHATVRVAGQGAGATLANVSAGDRVLLVTSGPATALIAASVYDRGPKPSAPSAPPSAPVPPGWPAPAPSVRWHFSGTVASVDAQAGTIVLTVAESPADTAAVGTQLTFTVGAQTSVVVADVNGDGTENLADVSSGDRAVIYIAAPASAPAPGATLAATAVYDVSAPPKTSASPPPASPPVSPPAAPAPPSTATAPPAASYWALNGTVTSVGSGTVDVTITQVFGAPSAYVGRTQQFTVSSSTRLKVADNNGDGIKSLADVSVGDSVSVYVLAPNPVPALGSALVAVEVSDTTTATPAPA